MKRAKTRGSVCLGLDISQIAAVAAIMVIVAAISCFDTTTNLCEKSGRRCRQGQVCAAHQNVCIDIGGCGDGVIDADKGEICDDGNNLDEDGCSADCKSNETCGNKITDTAVGEACDGQSNCSSDCQLQACGNGILDPGEVCDDGNAMPDDGCSANCKSNEACGNGIIDNDGPDGLLHEECEFADAPFPGPTVDTPDCNSDCTKPRCGDGHLNPFYLVPDSGSGHLEKCDGGVMGMPTDSPNCNKDCTFAVCGDGYTNDAAGEKCDEGKNNSNKPDAACRPDCRLPSCGDNIIDPGRGEQCDDGVDNSDTTADACRTNCQRHSCGDNVKDKDEECDNGMNNSDTRADACRTSCKRPFCGDGVKDTGEACDPKAKVDSDHPDPCGALTCGQNCRCG